MLLSVIIPVYNNPLALEQCLASFYVRRDLLDEVEFVVVDDGSDDAVTVSREEGVRLIRQPHGGASVARNAGIDVASGRFVWFFDADDCVDPDAFAALLSALRALPDDAELFHTGPMREVADNTNHLEPTGTTVQSSVAEILVPRSGCLDHTTYLISRTLLQCRPELRYPEGRSLLEDSLFVLRLLDAALVVYVNERLRPYLRKTSRHSVTAGSWSREQCRRWLPDIEAFFTAFAAFGVRHPDYQLKDLYNRYCYLYLRVLAVKGCPWTLLRDFRDRLREEGYRPATFKERLLQNTLVLALLSTSCRLLR